MLHPAHVVGLAATSGRWSLRLDAMCESLEWAMEETLDPPVPKFGFVLWAPRYYAGRRQEPKGCGRGSRCRRVSRDPVVVSGTSTESLCRRLA